MWGPSPPEKGDHRSLGVRKLHTGVSSFWPPYWDLTWLCGRALALCIELEALGTPVPPAPRAGPRSRPAPPPLRLVCSALTFTFPKGQLGSTGPPSRGDV